MLLLIFFWDYPDYWFCRTFGGRGTWQPRDGSASYSAECVEGLFSKVGLRLNGVLRSSQRHEGEPRPLLEPTAFTGSASPSPVGSVVSFLHTAPEVSSRLPMRRLWRTTPTTPQHTSLFGTQSLVSEPSSAQPGRRNRDGPPEALLPVYCAPWMASQTSGCALRPRSSTPP
jgi:hypothetical protein